MSFNYINKNKTCLHISKSGLFNLTILVHKETHSLNFYEPSQPSTNFISILTSNYTLNQEGITIKED